MPSTQCWARKLAAIRVRRGGEMLLNLGFIDSFAGSAPISSYFIVFHRISHTGSMCRGAKRMASRAQARFRARHEEVRWSEARGGVDDLAGQPLAQDSTPCGSKTLRLFRSEAKKYIIYYIII